MRHDLRNAAIWAGTGLSLLVTACGGAGGGTETKPPPIVTAITSVSVTPNPETATIGTQVQFAATVAGTGDYVNTVTWSLAGPSGSALNPGTLSTTGLYTTPYPAPASVTITATSTADSTKSGSVTVTFAPPAAAAGPALSVDAGNQTHAINPYIYGMSYYTGSSDAAAAKSIDLPLDRWGGDGTNRYNYLLDMINLSSDWYFENYPSSSPASTNPPTISGFNTQVADDAAVGAKSMGTVSVIGWTTKNNPTACGFSVAKYGAQQEVDPYRTDCGNGVLLNGTNITGNDPTDTSYAIGPSFAGNWVTFLVSQFGNAASGGVAIYQLDNEPSWWDDVSRDVHPVPFTYDEMTNNGIATAAAVKAADPTAEVTGPVMDNWWMYFYSKKDVVSGWATGPCSQPWSNPIDREAHNGMPLIEYYLQQFAAYDAKNSVRLLDYLDLHTYFAADYPAGSGNGVGLTTAGDTGAQEARLNSTRVFWDPTYTDPNYPQPNYTTDANYTHSCNVPLQAPQLIPMMRKWVDADYPGTKLAITEYNWGGQESINGALAQADILGIFGSYGLDLGMLWGPPDPTAQVPGLMAFKIFRNYDGKRSEFGDMALASTSSNQGLLSVYGALRTSDNVVTVVVINKTYGDLTATLSLANLTPSGAAQAYHYSNANPSAIVAQPNLTVTPPATGGTTSTVSATFPAQSITLIAVPQK